MGLEERLLLYDELEKLRDKPLITYVTSTRPNAGGTMAADAVGEITDQLRALPGESKELDFLIVSRGGDPIVAWQVVSLIRERVKTFSVLVPSAAFSAATLIALGGNSVYMHPNSNLGPVDPQITTRRTKPDGPMHESRFGSEDLAAFFDFAKEKVGLAEPDQLVEVFKKVCDEVGAVTIGYAARSARLSLTMGEKLLSMHMAARDSAKKIAKHLNTDYYHHGYALSRREAKDIGLKIEAAQPDVDKLLAAIWDDFVEEMKLREPFSPLGAVKANPDCAALFGKVPQANIPSNLPQQVQQQMLNQIMSQALVQIPPTSYTLINATVESLRHASRYVTEGLIFAARKPDLEIAVNVAPVTVGWRTVSVS